MQHARRATMAGLGLALCAALAPSTSAAAAPNSQDRQWLVAAHQSNLAEIAAGKAAQSKATTSTVRDLGQMFIDDHTALDAKVTAAAKKLDVSLPGAPSPAQRSQLQAVSAKSGRAFDAAWIAQQIGSHRATLAAGTQEISQGQDASAKALATGSAPIVKRHLNELLAASGSPSSVSAGTGGQAASSPQALGGVLVGGGVLGAVLASVALLRRRRSPA